jgi:hypothetical protein
MTEILLPITAVVFLPCTHIRSLAHSISYPIGTEDLGTEAVGASGELLATMWCRGEESGEQYFNLLYASLWPSACMKPSFKLSRDICLVFRREKF